MSKVDYVLSESRKQTNAGGLHHCHWPGCDKACAPAMWGCRAHWFQLPRHLRDKVWATYEPGQEISKTPSREYVMVAQEVEEWCLQQIEAAQAFGPKL